MSDIVWSPTLAQLAKNVRGLEPLIARGLENRGQYWATELEAEAKQTAPWTDRTGQARQGLTGRHEVNGMTLTISLFHTKDYGPFLELGTGKMPPYPAVLPTMQRNYPAVMNDLKKIFE